MPVYRDRREYYKSRKKEEGFMELMKEKSKRYRINTPEHREKSRLRMALKRSDPVQNKELNLITRKWRERLKIELLSHYSNGTMKCSHCGYSDIRALCLDHINNNGGDERRKLKGENKSIGYKFYIFLKKLNFPEGIQVLCWNCNHIKEFERVRNGV